MNRYAFSFRTINSLTVTLLISAVFTIIFNLRIEVAYLTAHPLDGAYSYLEAFAFFLFIFFLSVIFFSIFGFKYLQKTFIILMLLASTPALYFSLRFNTLFDETMLTNALETDFNEASDLLSSSFWLMFTFLGILPSIIIFKLPIKYKPFFRNLVANISLFIASLVLTAVVIAPFYAKFSSFVRNNNTVLKNSFLPYAPIHALYKNLTHKSFSERPKPVIFDSEARIISSHKKQKPLLLIVMVGETARESSFTYLLDNFSKDKEFLSYSKNLIYFNKTSSCGTNTAASLPCMFSTYPKSDYKREYNVTHENIAETIQRVGYSVNWIDNNSGCKGICNHIPNEKISHTNSKEFSSESYFYDEALIDNLDEKTIDNHSDQVIFLHQIGSHGPAYYKRAPKKFKRLQPSCESKDFGLCSRKEIANAYDNSIIYTNFVLAKTIKKLRQLEENYDTALIYLSDHGESTGEGGYYLHGIPYFIAPEEQTRVPMLMWISDGFASSKNVSLECLQNKKNEDNSHDNFSHSLLGILDIATKDYLSDLDLFSNCRG